MFLFTGYISKDTATSLTLVLVYISILVTLVFILSILISVAMLKWRVTQSKTVKLNRNTNIEETEFLNRCENCNIPRNDREDNTNLRTFPGNY